MICNSRSHVQEKHRIEEKNNSAEDILPILSLTGFFLLPRPYLTLIYIKMPLAAAFIDISPSPRVKGQSNLPSRRLWSWQFPGPELRLFLLKQKPGT